MNTVGPGRPVDAETPPTQESIPSDGSGYWPSWSMGVLIASVLLMGWIDWATGPRLSLILFYLAPVTLAGWFLGKRFAIVIAVLASTVCFVADLDYQEGSYLAIYSWNALTLLGTFGVVGVGMAMLRHERDQLTSSLDRLAALSKHEAKSARVDNLTGLHNSRSFYEELEREWARFVRHGQPMSLLFIDVDNFKNVNDGLGHRAGDDLLQTLALELLGCVRREDVAGRMGGDEFAVLLPGVPVDEARRVADRYQEQVQKLTSTYPNVSFGVSIGVATADKNMMDSEAIMRAADSAMYRVKEAGKGGVAIDYNSEGHLTVLRPGNGSGRSEVGEMSNNGPG